MLNYGRFKLGALSLGGAKAVIVEAAKYASTRKQFGQPIGNFGAIKHKLGQMTAWCYMVESMMHRTAGLIDQAMEAGEGTHPERLRFAMEEYAAEASIAKVAGSEMLDYVIDENLQIHGGNGFVRDYPAERHYRDSRVNRIFEGTNEINRLLIPGMLMRRALKGDLPLIPAAMKVFEEVMSPAMPEMPGDEHLENEARAVAAFKKVGLLLLGGAMQKYQQKVTDEQEVLSFIADILIDVFGCESALLRARDAHDRAIANAAQQADVVRVLVSDAAARIEAAAKTVIAAIAEGDMQRTQLAALRRVLKVTPANAIALRRGLADATIARGSYIFT